MRNWIETTGKTVDDAIGEAIVALGTSLDNIDYEIIEEPVQGFLGINKKPARIKAAVKPTKFDKAVEFLDDVLTVMEIQHEVKGSYDEEEKTMSFDILGDNMGVLIGKRGQTLDSLQYLVSLVVNKESEEYIKIKLDTENYRERRKETLENLAKNIAGKVKKTGKQVALEPMNPYERRIIHSTLQNDKYVETYSEGEEPYRKVIIALKKGVRPYSKYNNNRQGYGNRRGGFQGYGKNRFDKKKTTEREPYRYGHIEEGEVYEGVTVTIDPSEQI